MEIFHAFIISGRAGASKRSFMILPFGLACPSFQSYICQGVKEAKNREGPYPLLEYMFSRPAANVEPGVLQEYR
jgi:hypothetical protein